MVAMDADSDHLRVAVTNGVIESLRDTQRVKQRQAHWFRTGATATLFAVVFIVAEVGWSLTTIAFTTVTAAIAVTMWIRYYFVTLNRIELDHVPLEPDPN